MSEAWKEIAADIGKIIRGHAEAHPELVPLVTSFVNFTRKAGIDGADNAGGEDGTESGGLLAKALNDAGLLVVPREDYRRIKERIDGQAEEIDALELRIKRLLGKPRRPVAPPRSPMVGVECI